MVAGPLHHYDWQWAQLYHSDLCPLLLHYSAVSRTAFCLTLLRCMRKADWQFVMVAKLLCCCDCALQVLQADGGTRCACINAASMALADAGIPMRDAVASCAVGFLQSTALLDLNYMEDSGGGPDISVAVHPNMDRLVLLQMDGKLPPEVYEECVALAVEGCKAVASVMRQELLRHTKRLAITTGIVGMQ